MLCGKLKGDLGGGMGAIWKFEKKEEKKVSIWAEDSSNRS